MSIHTSAKCAHCEEKETLTHCKRCNRAYCEDCASIINPGLYCFKCQSDITITETRVSKTETDFDIQRDRLISSTHVAKQIVFKGIDWMFAVRKIAELPDEELKPILHYHRAFVYQLEQEILSRNIRKAHQQAQTTLKKVGGVVSVHKITKTKTVKTAKVTQTVTPEQLVQFAMKFGLNSKEDLLNFIASNKIQ